MSIQQQNRIDELEKQVELLWIAANEAWNAAYQAGKKGKGGKPPILKTLAQKKYEE